MSVKIKQTDYQPIPLGEYPAEVVNVELTEGKFGRQVQFTFCVTDGPHEGKTLRAWTSMTFSPQSKLFAWSRIMLNRPIAADYDFDGDDVLGKKVTLVVLVKTNQDGSEFNRIDSIKHYVPTNTNGGQRPPSEPAEDISF